MVKKGNKKKTLFLIAYAVSIVFTILGAAALLIYERSVSNKIYKENVQQVLYTASNMVDIKITEYQDMFDKIAENCNLNDLVSIKRDFKILNDNDDTILNIYYVDEATGKFTGALDLTFEGMTDARTYMEWYEGIAADPENVYLSEVYDDELTGRPTVTLYKGIKKDNVLYGVICIDIDLTYLEKDISVFKYGETGEVEIIDSSGIMAVHRDQSKIGSTEPTTYSVWNYINENSSGNVKFKHNNVDYEGYFVESERMYWKILIKNDVNEIRANEIAQRKIIFGITIVSVILETVLFAIAFKDKKKREI